MNNAQEVILKNIRSFDDAFGELEQLEKAIFAQIDEKVRAWVTQHEGWSIRYANYLYYALRFYPTEWEQYACSISFDRKGRENRYLTSLFDDNDNFGFWIDFHGRKAITGWLCEFMQSHRLDRQGFRVDADNYLFLPVHLDRDDFIAQSENALLGIDVALGVLHDNLPVLTELVSGVIHPTVSA